MRRSALLLLAIGAACHTTTPHPPASCRDAGQCTGCCDADDRCRPGDGALSCGSEGRACVECAAHQQCSAGACADVSVPGCGPTTCTGCCDDGGVCRAGRSPQVCGEGGGACASCPAGRLCSAGACVTITQCDVACGAQCCAGASCAGSPCGFDGGACTTCTGGALCLGDGGCGAGGPRWRLRIVSARVEPTRPNGDPWDDKNDPDAKVCANVGDAGQSCTLEQTDTFLPAWNTLFPASYELGQLEQVELSVIDVDFPGQTVIEELGVLDLRPRWSTQPQRWTLDGASVRSLRIDVEPAP